MTQEIRAFTALIPAGTAQDDPVTVDLSFPPRTVNSISLRIPPGPSGQMGFRILNSGLQVIPYNNAEWLVTDNEVINWTLTDAITSGSWQLAGYNAGTYNHSVYVRFLLDPPPQPSGAGTFTPIDTALLNTLTG